MNRANRQAIILGFVIVAIIALAMYGLPQYRVYSQELAGKAQLREADWNRQIQIREAEAARESARLLAEAEVERARGVAEANLIIGDSLKDNEAYLRYLFIQSLKTSDSDVIYIPTEAGLPILEAGRLG
ncbi:MAG: membrane protease subunit [Candidatus Woesearchaeota archaeon]